MISRRITDGLLNGFTNFQHFQFVEPHIMSFILLLLHLIRLYEVFITIECLTRLIQTIHDHSSSENWKKIFRIA